MFYAHKKITYKLKWRQCNFIFRIGINFRIFYTWFYNNEIILLFYRNDIKLDNLEDKLRNDKLSIEPIEGKKICWTVVPTEKPTIDFLSNMLKVSEYLKAGAEVTIILADILAYLDNIKTPWNLLKPRAEYYQAVLETILKSFENVPLDKLKFIKGTDFQFSK